MTPKTWCAPATSLVLQNVRFARGSRSSMRMEPALWEALDEICAREGITRGEFIRRAAGSVVGGTTTSAARVAILEYFRAAATDDGHAGAGHGRMRHANNGG